MKPIQDNFSEQAAQYARYRPVYPKELFDFIYSQTPATHTAWDCGTGNGQVAIVLAQSFQQVFATDISQAQLKQAPPAHNITYLQARAEQTTFAANTFDLITVAQAIHWFDFEHFFQEVKRTAKPSGILAVWGYGLLQIAPEIDAVIWDFYTHRIGKYWDKERSYIDEAYQTIPFPFQEIHAPLFAMKIHWSLHELEGYLLTWSSVQKYIAHTRKNPVSKVIEKFRQYWQIADERKEIRFPICMRIGSV